MAPQSQIMARFLIPSVSYSYFVYRSRFCIDERPETYCALVIFDLMEQGGYDEEHMAPGGQSVLCFLVPSVNYRYFMYRLRFYINERQTTTVHPRVGFFTW